MTNTTLSTEEYNKVICRIANPHNEEYEAFRTFMKKRYKIKAAKKVDNLQLLERSAALLIKKEREYYGKR